MSDEQQTYKNTIQENEVVFDLFRIAGDMWQGFLRFWWFGFMLFVVSVVGVASVVTLMYTPTYDAYASFVVTESLTSNQTTSDYSVATRIGTTFSTILETGVLRNVVEQELGIEELESEITATSLSSTNIITIHVIDEDPELAAAVLESVMTNYPIVAEYILGATQLDVVYESGVPTEPVEERNLVRMILFGAVGGIAVFGLFLLIYAFTRKTLVSVNDLQALTRLAYITGVPKVLGKKRTKRKNASFLIYRNNKNPAFLESFRVFSNTVEKDAQDNNHKVYLLTSTTDNEDKTATALNLARMLSHRKYNVLFLDLDLRTTQVQEMLDLTIVRDHHLAGMLQGKASFSSAMQQIGRHSKFDLLPSVTGDIARVFPLLSGPGLLGFVQSCRQHYDFIIIDTPPLGVYADAALVAPCADSAILVTKQEVTLVPYAVKTIEQLVETGIHTLGFVMNGISRDSGGYGYGQGYTYGQGYGYNYAQGYRYAQNTYAENQYAVVSPDEPLDDEEIAIDYGAPLHTATTLAPAQEEAKLEQKAKIHVDTARRFDAAARAKHLDTGARAKHLGTGTRAK